MNRFIPALLALALAAPAAPAQSVPPKPADKPVAVPFEWLKSGHMAVQVKLNGKGPYRLIFDTGAPITLINNRIARESGVIGAKTPAPFFSPFGAMGDSSIKEMEVGDLKAKDVTTVVMDHPTVKALADALGPIDGIVGFPFFARFATTIDYKAKQLTFKLNGYEPGNVMRGLEQTVMAMMTRDPSKPTVLTPAAQWGLVAGKDSDDEAAGVDVRQVMPGSAADKAGLKAGDRILTVDGRWTDSVADLFRAAGTVKPGQPVPVAVRRGGKDVAATVTPLPGL